MLFILDVVTAYKSLLKEKEALDASLSAISKNLKDYDGSKESPSTQVEKDDNMTVMMNSLATLSKEDGLKIIKCQLYTKLTYF